MRKDLLTWYKKHGRHLPWRTTRDPYKVLVSEIMLQQTQVPRVIPKYRAFVKTYPTINALAEAPRQDVLRLWQGLGYNTRAARLHALAKLVVKEHQGILPTTQAELQNLPGIGPYTAGAVIIFSQDIPAESVDVNIARVLKRIHFTPRQRPTDKHVRELALDLIRKTSSPHDWHSALMDFGSTICTTRPQCADCPLRAHCRTRGRRPDEKTRKQHTFQGSNRWWRGQILKHVLAGATTEAAVLKKIGKRDKKSFRNALTSLKAEGILKNSTRLRVQ